MRAFFAISLLVFFSLPVLARETPAITDTPAAVKDIALDKPNMTEKEVLAFAETAVSKSLTFGSNNIDSVMEESRKMFTKEGWKSFSKALSKSRMIKKVMNEQGKLTVWTASSGKHITSKPIEPASIVAEGAPEGRYHWVINVPIILVQYTGEIKSATPAKSRIIVERVPVEENPAGFGIRTLIMH